MIWFVYVFRRVTTRVTLGDDTCIRSALIKMTDGTTQEPLALCLVLDLVELLKELVIVMKIACGTREARAIDFMSCVPLFLILSHVVFCLSIPTI